MVTKLKDRYIRKVECFRILVTWLNFKILLSKLTRGTSLKLKKISNSHAKKLQNVGLSSQGVTAASNVIFNFFK